LYAAATSHQQGDAAHELDWSADLQPLQKPFAEQIDVDRSGEATLAITALRFQTLGAVKAGTGV